MSQIETIMSSKAAMIALAIVAFLVAALLVLVIVRMLFGGRLRMPGGRARQARLGIVDAFDLDRQRQLIIVRRDNTEHLIMIGGPNDLLIEPEIVRVEARDFRDGRRDPLAAAASDGRIPAPMAAERGEPRAPDVPQRPADEPMLPMPLPVAAPPVAPQTPPSFEPATADGSGSPVAIPPNLANAPSPVASVNGQVEPVAPRVPTFPLPPRRPAPAPPERRTAPPPLRLPDTVSRGDDRAQPAAPSLEPVGAAPPLAPPASAPPRTAPPFLKPLPPRPPVRPLQRTTPQPAAGTAQPVPTIGQPPKEPAAQAPAAPVQRPQPAPAPEQPKAPETNDALESLEEEMAKLLGRGPG
jgi:hypothetical protein